MLVFVRHPEFIKGEENRVQEHRLLFIVSAETDFRGEISVDDKMTCRHLGLNYWQQNVEKIAFRLVHAQDQESVSTARSFFSAVSTAQYNGTRRGILDTLRRVTSSQDEASREIREELIYNCNREPVCTLAMFTPLYRELLTAIGVDVTQEEQNGPIMKLDLMDITLDSGGRVTSFKRFASDKKVEVIA